MQQLTITIGRNVGATPMSDDDWSNLKSAIDGIVSRIVRPESDFGWFTGVGEWEGVSEESAIRVVLLPYGFPRATDLDSALRIAAGVWSQDAIAWSLGDSFLAERRHYVPSDVDAL
jgi:hypothetical protein